MIKKKVCKSHEHLNKKKDLVCFKHRNYIELIDGLGNGVMMLSQLEEFMQRISRISSRTVYNHLKELESLQIIDSTKIDKVKLISLKKYAYRFLKEQETGQEVKSRDISSPRVTNGKVKKSAWVCEYVLQITKGTEYSFESIVEYFKLNTSLITTNKDVLTCFNNFITNKNINEEVRRNVRYNVYRENSFKKGIINNLASENEEFKKIEKSDFSFNRMRHNNLYVTGVTPKQINITYLDIQDIFNESKMLWIIEFIYKAFCEDMFSYLTPAATTKRDIKVVIQLLFNSIGQTSNARLVYLTKKRILEEKIEMGRYTLQEQQTLNMINNIDVRFNCLEINKKVFKNEFIIF